MKQLSANISFMFSDVPFLERFERAKNAGFSAVEFHFPYEHDPQIVKAKLVENNLKLVLFNTAAGDVAAGEWGLGSVPKRKEGFRSHITQALDYAKVLEPIFIHVMCGKCDPNQRDLAKETYIENLHWVTRQSSEITFLVEALNQRDMPGYFLSHQKDSAEIVNAVNQPNLKLMFDLYHVQIMDGDVTKNLEKFLPLIGHIQIAAVPTRHEPDEGELNYKHVFQKLKELNYTGYIGCEYKPRAKTEDGLKWISQLLAPNFN